MRPLYSARALAFQFTPTVAFKEPDIPNSTPMRDPIQIIEAFNLERPRGLIQIGASAGREIAYFYNSGITKAVLIEPLSGPFEVLKAQTANLPNYLLVNALCGSENGKAVDFFVSTNNGESSSILPPAKHLTDYPQVGFTKIEGLSTVTADHIMERVNAVRPDVFESIDFLFIDVQGAELEVLKGAAATLRRLKYIYTEVGTGDGYHGAAHLADMMQFLRGYGFNLYEMQANLDGWGNAMFIKIPGRGTLAAENGKSPRVTKLQNGELGIMCCGGLGNRLGSLLGGLMTAKVIGRTPVALWPENSWCGAGFSDLFDGPFSARNEGIKDLTANNLDAWFLVHENQTPFELKNRVPHHVDSLNFLTNQAEPIVYYHNQVPAYFPENATIATLGTLHIRSTLRQRVNEFIQKHQITRETLGIHFRKTDYPVQLDETSIFQLIEQNPAHRFFVCSDDADTEVKFGALPNVVTFPKTSYVEKLTDGDWNAKIQDADGRDFNFNVLRSRESVIEGFCDMLILSRTNIISQSPSSFLRFARLFSSLPL